MFNATFNNISVISWRSVGSGGCQVQGKLFDLTPLYSPLGKPISAVNASVGKMYEMWTIESDDDISPVLYEVSFYTLQDILYIFYQLCYILF
jgi:hypothetical protein